VGGHGSAEQNKVFGRRLFELKGGRKDGENRGTKLSSSPVFCASREEERLQCRSKRHRFELFFFNSV